LCEKPIGLPKSQQQLVYFFVLVVYAIATSIISGSPGKGAKTAFFMPLEKKGRENGRERRRSYIPSTNQFFF
jgi:hypothetical protein